MKLIFLLVVFFFSTLIIECKSDQTKVANKELSSELAYKKWLGDTLSILKKESDINHRKYSINKDSSSLMITTKLDTIIEKKMITSNFHDPELNYSLSLLQRNKIMPKKEFRLISVTQYHYDLPFKNVGLVYDFQVDVTGFYVITDDSQREYKFMKGNLTDSISINSLPNLQNF